MTAATRFPPPAQCRDLTAALHFEGLGKTRRDCGVTHTLVISCSMGMLKGIHRSTSEPSQQYHVSPCICGAWHELSTLPCPCVHLQHCPNICRQQEMRQVVHLHLCVTAINCSLISLTATIPAFSHSTSRPRQFQHARHVGIKVLRPPENKRTRVLHSVTSNHARCV